MQAAASEWRESQVEGAQSDEGGVCGERGAGGTRSTPGQVLDRLCGHEARTSVPYGYAGAQAKDAHSRDEAEHELVAHVPCDVAQIDFLRGGTDSRTSSELQSCAQIDAWWGGRHGAHRRGGVWWAFVWLA